MYNKNNKEDILYNSLYSLNINLKKISYENQIKSIADISILLPINIHKNVKRL